MLITKMVVFHRQFVLNLLSPDTGFTSAQQWSVLECVINGFIAFDSKNVTFILYEWEMKEKGCLTLLLTKSIARMR